MNKNLTFKKDDIIFDITTRAENVKFDESNVKEEINKFNKRFDSISVGEGGGIIVDNSEHNSLKINSEEGAHNFRFHNNKFSHKNEEGEWEDIEGEGGGIIVDNSEHNSLKINSEEGAHNFRFHNNKFSHKNEEGEWEDIEIVGSSSGGSGGSGIKLPPTKFIEITSNDTSNIIKWEDANNQVLNGTTIVGSSSGGSGGSGIKLPPTKFIEITSNDTSNIIKWEDANNQVLNGTTISTWAGTKLIRKIDSPPTNEYDGEVLVDNTERDFYKITGFVDEDIRLDTIYYYALFPYSTDGTYKGEGGGIIVDNSEHNSLKINSEEGAHNFRFHNNKFSHKNEEGEWEDIEIVGSGSGGSGIKLPPTKFIEITSNDTSNIIKWEDADDQVLNGSTISTWAGTKLIRKIDSPPTNEHDGEVLVDNTERDFYKITGFVDEDIRLDTIYYYALFPYSTDGTYNYDISNIRKFYKNSAAVYKITGFVDEDIRLDTIYYYALFPYSTDGTYNYDISNIRKFYKNSAAVPENTTGIQVIPDRSAIKLKWSDGQSTLNSLWAGTKVVRKIGSPPTTETDGTLIIDNINRDKYKTTYFIDDTATQNVEYFYGFFPYSRDGHYNTNIENVLIIDNINRDKYKTTYFIDDTATQNVEYFYGFFPYSRDGHYNTNIENVASCTPATGKIYTLNIDLNNTSPSGACTHLDDAVNIGTGDAFR